MRLDAFLFSEMVRNEANGQITIVGLFPGDTVIFHIPKEVEFNQLPNLACVIVLGGMEKIAGLRYQCSVRSEGDDIINAPAEHIMRPTPLQPYQTLMFGFQPFLCSKGAGDYEFRITVQPDKQPSPTTYSKTFKIQRRNVDVQSQQVTH